MLITSITIENFKGIAEPVTVPLKPITLLFGRNSAGKSTILQAMLYALEIIKNGNCDPDRVELGGASIDLGGFANLVHKHETDRIIKLRFDLDLRGESWVRPEGTLAAERGVKRREFPIDEFLPDWSAYNQFGIDLSNLGDEYESAWVELQIGQLGHAAIPRVLEWEIGYADWWLARVGQHTWRWGQTSDAVPTAILNECHGILSTTHVLGSSFYGMFGPSFCNQMYKLYNGGLDTDAPSPDDPGWRDFAGKVLPKVWKPVYTRLADGMCVEFYLDTEQIGTGQEIVLTRYHKTGAGAAEDREQILHRMLAENQPEILSLGKHGMPDWTVPFRTGNPISKLRRRATQPARHPEVDPDDYDRLGMQLDFDAGAGAQFLDQALERMLYGPVVWLRDELDSIRYIGPLRDLPGRRAKAPRTPDRHRWASGLAAWDALKEDPQLVDTVNKCLAKHLKVNYQFDRREYIQIDKSSDLYTFMRGLAHRYDDFTGDDFRAIVLDELEASQQSNLTLRDVLRDVTVAPSDIGVGISQVLPVVAGAFATNSGGPYCGIFAVEQPELHVHPAIQVGLGDIFIRAIRENPNRLMLIETHSEHMTLRLMRRMRETFDGSIADETLKATPKDIAILYVEIFEGRTLVREMPLNERGELVKAWPGGFFEEDLEEIL